MRRGIGRLARHGWGGRAGDGGGCGGWDHPPTRNTHNTQQPRNLESADFSLPRAKGTEQTKKINKPNPQPNFELWRKNFHQLL